MLKNKEVVIPYLLLAAIIVAGLLWHEGENIPSLGRSIVSGKADIGGPYTLTDQNGKPRSNSEFRGRYQLIYFGYSFCPDVCPTTLSVIAEALSKLGPESIRIVPIFITVDPARDSPAVLKQYMGAFGDAFVGLTGTPKQISMVEREFHVFAKKQPIRGGSYGMDHSSVIYLMGPDGRLISYWDGLLSPADLAKDLKQKI